MMYQPTGTALLHVFMDMEPEWEEDINRWYDEEHLPELMGEEVLPAVREMGKELGLHSPFEVDPLTNRPIAAAAVEPRR